MKKPKIIRKRYKPDESVDISSDELIFRNSKMLVTRWKSIKPRKDFATGMSFTFLQEGYKISRFYDAYGKFLFWYCDILDIEYSEKEDEFILKDLLVDVKIMPDGKVYVLDVGELAEMIEINKITHEQSIKALENLDKILDMINNDKFPPEICKDERFLKAPQEEKIKEIVAPKPIKSKKIRVITVDDSVFFNKLFSDALVEDTDIEVIANAFDTDDADKKIKELKPDVLTLDVVMPGLNGIEFLEQLMMKNPIPVIVVSSHGFYILDALRAGAVEFVEKPNSTEKNAMKTFAQDIASKIKIAANAKLDNIKGRFEVVDKKIEFTKNTVIVIGASTGGTEATNKILASLPAYMPPILIAQHMPQSFTAMYAERLNKFSELTVKEAVDGDILTPGVVLVAPGDFHMSLKKEHGQIRVVCNKDEKVNGHRPSVDVLFNSATEVVGSGAIGIILTGMGSDGAKGLLKMKNKGCATIGQNEATCVVYGMPKVAFDLGAVGKQVPIDKVAETLIDILKNK